MKPLRTLNTIADLDRSTALKILDIADHLESHIRENGHAPALLRGKCLAMVFDETSLRTRNAFERGMTDLGGHAIFFSGKEARIGRRAEKQENLRDFVNVISGFNHALLSRIYDHALQSQIVSLCAVPFINAMCDRHHPTQALCDFLTIRRRLGRLDGAKVAFVGDGTNVATSLAQLANLVGARFSISTPEGWEPAEGTLRALDCYHWTSDPLVAVRDADVVISDVWIPMNKGHEAASRCETLAPYRVTRDLMRHAKPHAFFMHNLPANRGYEVEAEVIDGPQSAVYEEAVSRLHIARALLLMMLAPSAADGLQLLAPVGEVACAK